MRKNIQVQVRRATVADAAAIARVHVESSEDAYAPLAKQWDAPDVAARKRMWAGWLTEAQGNPKRVDLVAELDARVVAFITAGPPRQDEIDIDAEVEVYVIHVLPEHRGTGVGSALWAQACALTRGPGLRSLCVRTFAELRCCSFYEARGGRVAATARTTYKGGDVTEVAYRWSAGETNEPGR